MRFLRPTGAVLALSSLASHASAGVIKREADTSSSVTPSSRPLILTHHGPPTLLTDTTTRTWATGTAGTGNDPGDGSIAESDGQGTHSATGSSPVIPGASGTTTGPGGVAPTSGGIVQPGATTTPGPGSPTSSGALIPSAGSGVTATSGGVIVSGTYVPGATVTSGGIIVSGTFTSIRSGATSGAVIPGQPAVTTTSGGVIVSGTYIPGATITSGGIIVSGTFTPISTGAASSGAVIPGLPGVTTTNGGVIVSGTYIPGATITSGEVMVNGTMLPSASSGIVIPPALATTTPITPGPGGIVMPAASITATLSSISSEIAGLIPIITGWEANPAGSPGAAGSVSSAIGDVAGAMAGLGGTPGPPADPCGQAINPANIISSILNILGCIWQDLGDIAGGISNNNPAGVGIIVPSLDGDNGQLGDVQSDVTAPIEVTPTATVTTATATTTTIDGTLLPTDPPCSSDTCGSACTTRKRNANPIPEPQSFSEAHLALRALGKRVLPPATPFRAAELNHWLNLNPQRWVTQGGDEPSSGQWFEHPVRPAGDDNGFWTAVGVNGIYGCTAVLIISSEGIYASHIWEIPGFLNPNTIDLDPPEWTDDEFNTRVLQPILQGSATVQSLTQLVDQRALNPGNRPRVHVITPQTSQNDRARVEIYKNMKENAALEGNVALVQDIINRESRGIWPPENIGAELRYNDRAHWLANQLAAAVGDDTGGSVWGYTRSLSAFATDADDGTLRGRTMMEAEPNVINDVTQMMDTEWRLWVADQETDSGVIEPFGINLGNNGF